MPFPRDQAELLRSAAESEAVLEQTADTNDPKLLEKHARELFKLGEIRRRLGETEEAERLLAASADANLKVGTAIGAHLSAMSRYALATIAAKDERYREACGHIDRMIESNEGFPKFETTRQGPVPVLELWLTVLEAVEDYERLYEASGIALELIEPAESPAQRVALGQTLALRAKSAAEFGRAEEAVDLYERAIAQLEGEEPSPQRDRYLNQAMMRLPGLLGDLDRLQEASDAITRLERLQGGHPVLKGTRVAARMWKRWVD